jgi:hypothetical protein
MIWRKSTLLVAGLGTMVLGSTSVLADSRQDVLSGVQRCAGITDDRTWLDCFYGSAQPMRARLGLPPAPVNQQRLVPPMMGAVPAYAAPAYAPPAAPAYAAPAYAPPVYAAPAYAAPATAPTYAAPAYAAPAAPAYAAPGANVASAGPPPLPRRRSSGFFDSVFGTAKPVVANQRMAAWNKNGQGRFVITLADGEIWQQDPGDNGDPKWRGNPTRFVVNIYEGALGSYNLNVSDDSTLYKVHRVN